METSTSTANTKPAKRSKAASHKSVRLYWYKWCPADFHNMARGWPVTTRGVYRELLDTQWEHGHLPKYIQALRAVINATTSEWNSAWPTISSSFPVCRDGKRRNEWLEDARKQARRKVLVLKANASAGGTKKAAVAKAKANAIANAKANGSADAQAKALPLSDSDSQIQDPESNNSINGSNGDKDRLSGGPEQKPNLMPSEAAMTAALEQKQGITRDDMLESWFRFAHGKAIPSVEAAFLTFARKHEPTDAQRQRARATDRRSAPEHAGEAAARAIADIRSR